ncbi:pantothenate synthetase [Aliidongia dinghuensis]|uniref:Pantothenate synthetase n=1 Tax=Aliidongia dinghuensis TaxID=1867774 RepID=A0A8J2YUS3_9PROT|nr:pantoate--beta-alanine ligase [Aliidongia dinghuensis]GGF22554.1 pantothenate synthetase [Aliidongia dinghuensis]
MSTTAPPILRTVADLRDQIARWRREGARIGLIPTMGALHDGHMALVRRALDAGERAVVSIFVNPTQFGPNEDFAAYPRREAEDVAKLAAIGGHLVWAPMVEEMYPEGFATHVAVSRLTDGLDGPFRPGHFQGVATVVTKLLLQVLPDRAYFGEKDYQQLQVVRRMVRDLDIPTEIVGVPTVREADGLALSSRNVYLSPEERRIAAMLPQVMRETADAALAGQVPFAELLAAAKARLAAEGFGPIDYVSIYDAERLVPVEDLARPARLFAAARIGRTRLIDNIPIEASAA